MEMLRTAVSSDSFDDPDKDSNDADANRRKAMRLIAKMPTMVARYERRRAGEEPIPPDPRSATRPTSSTCSPASSRRRPRRRRSTSP